MVAFFIFYFFHLKFFITVICNAAMVDRLTTPSFTLCVWFSAMSLPGACCYHYTMCCRCQLSGVKYKMSYHFTMCSVLCCCFTPLSVAIKIFTQILFPFKWLRMGVVRMQVEGNSSSNFCLFLQIFNHKYLRLLFYFLLLFFLYCRHQILLFLARVDRKW